ncbi:efflux RND transporter permease subunit [Dongia deserti]|uniref:efflux RND transporter permease subunit n=1 Tax=Dongia deserti TaxID=2268030 RepID=UPI000E6574D9|nr:efflux RND transporter permease subunit [Dongia deserti]
MNISEFCIRRPIATLLMSVALIVGGLFAFGLLPVAALPRTDYPVINVSADLPGASPDTMAKSVATPLIKQFTTIEGITSISATSTQGDTDIVIEFDLDRDIDDAAADVQSAISRTTRRLPEDMEEPPSYRKLNPADQAILLLALRSNVMALSQLDDFAQQVMSPRLSTLTGVAQVLVYGSQKYAVRIQVDPNALASRDIGIDELQDAVRVANTITPVGVIKNQDQSLTIQAETNLNNAAQFADLIIATRDGKPVRLRDVAKVIDSVENNESASWFEGTRSIVLAIQRQPDANTVEVVDRVKEMLPQFREELPPTVSIDLLNDRSRSVREAVHDVELTLMLTIALVILVIFLFLRRLNATFIASAAVPISLIATVGGMYLLNFSIDNISLLALTLAVGLVVDDAIVMLENIVRHIEEGMPPFEAALKGSREIAFTIISITVSLVAVFIPVLLMGGVVGLIFHEFAVVVTMAIAASAFVSLTLTPMLCARMLKPLRHGPVRAGLFDRALEGGFNAMLAVYDSILKFCLRFRPLMLMVFLATVVGTAWFYVTIPKGFFPQEDIGQIYVSTEAREDIAFPAMVALQQQVESVFRRSPHVTQVASIVGSGGGSPNSGRLFVELKPKGERPELDTVLNELRRELSQIAGISAYMSPVQNLRLGGRTSRSQYQFVLQAVDQDALFSWSETMAEAMTRDPHFADVSSDLEASAQQATLIVDQDKANALGISSDQLRSTLYSGFGTRQISTIYATGDNYSVVVEFDPSISWSPDLLNTVYVRSASAKLVPIGAFAEVRRTVGALSINQLGQLPAVTISFNLPPGVSLGDAVERTEQLRTEIGLPSTITSTFSGSAQVFQDALDNQGLLILAAVLTIYIVLGMLYESFVHPFTILTGLPSAAIGAFIALRMVDMDLSVVAVIGILMLIGIVKKNAIMMIDVALTLQREGMDSKEAIYRACILRFRPIMMTTFAAIMGALPIALGAGASAELRQPLGIAVVGGLVLSQILTLFITPVLYLYMERVSELLRGLRKTGLDRRTA